MREAPCSTDCGGQNPDKVNPDLQVDPTDGPVVRSARQPAGGTIVVRLAKPQVKLAFSAVDLPGACPVAFDSGERCRMSGMNAARNQQDEGKKLTFA